MYPQVAWWQNVERKAHEKTLQMRVGCCGGRTKRPPQINDQSGRGKTQREAEPEEPSGRRKTRREASSRSLRRSPLTVHRRGNETVAVAPTTTGTDDHEVVNATMGHERSTG